MKYDLRVPLLEQTPLPGGYQRLAVRAPDIARALAPGQFVQLRIDPDGVGPLLRRPFAPSFFDPESGRLELVYAVVGRGTKLLAGKGPGWEVGLLGPLGRGYSRPSEHGADAALIAGGGCGAPGLRMWLRALRAAGIPTGVALGARSADLLLEMDAWHATGADRLLPATDDGSAGIKGHAVAGVEALLADPLFAPRKVMLYGCGPRPMLAALARLAAARGLPCEVSLEERMACGFGACMGCAVAVRADGDATVYERVCRDGPVFDAARLLW